jgi:hypothetical protein
MHAALHSSPSCARRAHLRAALSRDCPGMADPPQHCKHTRSLKDLLARDMGMQGADDQQA